MHYKSGMPWRCERCGVSVSDDGQADCPTFRTPKSAWTLVAEKTRLGIYNGTSDAAYVFHKTKSGKLYNYALAILDVPKGHHDRLEHTVRAVDLAVRIVN